MDRDDICWVQGMLCLIVSYVAPAGWQPTAFVFAAIVLFVLAGILFVLGLIERSLKRKIEKSRGTGGPR